MTGVLVNTGAILVGGAIGLTLKNGIPKRFSDVMMKALALSVIYIALTGIVEGGNALVVIISMVIGTFLGTALKLDERLNAGAEKLQSKMKTGGFAEGFTTATLLFCVGAMAVVGSLKAGLDGDNSVLFSKSLIDGVTAVIFASTLGWGVLCSSVSILVYQGSIVLLSGLIAPLLPDNTIAQLTVVGSLLILAIGLNMLGLTKIKVMNMLPAVFIPVFLMMIPYFSGQG